MTDLSLTNILVIAAGGAALVVVLVMNFVLLRVLHRLTGSLTASDLAAAKAATDVSRVVLEVQLAVEKTQAVSEHARDTVEQVAAMHRAMMEVLPTIQAQLAANGVELLDHGRRLDVLEHPGKTEETPV